MIERSVMASPERCETVMDHQPPPPLSHVLKLLYWRVRRDKRTTPHVAAVLFRFGRSFLTLWLGKYVGRARSPTMAIALIEHLGDIVAAEPVARAARRRFPRHRIVWLVKSAYAELPASYPPVDRVVTVRCLTETMLLRACGLFDEVWDLHLSGRACERCRIPLVRPGHGPDTATYYRFGNLITAQCLSAGIPLVPGGPVLSPPSHAVAKVNRLGLPTRFVAIHCMSNERARDWPVACWRRLVAAITGDLSVDVIEVGLRPLVIEHDGERARSLCGKLSIMETAEVIRRAALFVGIDSGPAHLANAVGTQGVVLFGPFLGLDDYMPYSGGYQDGGTADLLRAAGTLENLPVEIVLGVVARRLRGVAKLDQPAAIQRSNTGRPGCGAE